MPSAASTLLRVAAAAALLGVGTPAAPLGAERPEGRAEAPGWRGEDVARAFAAARAQSALVLVEVWAPW